MFSLTDANRFFLYPHPTDMRNSFYRLSERRPFPSDCFFERNDSRSIRSGALICASTFLLIWNSVSIIYCSVPFEDLSQYTKLHVVHKKANTLRYNNISYNANIIVLPT